MSRFKLFLMILVMGSSLCGASPVFAGGEGDIFLRLLAKSELLGGTPGFRKFANLVLGAEISNYADHELAEATLRRLQSNGEIRLARTLERRLEKLEFAGDTGTAYSSSSASKLIRGASEQGLSNTLLDAVSDVALSSRRVSKILNIYENLLKSTPEVRNYFPEEEVYSHLADEELIGFSKALGRVFTKINSAPANLSTREKIRASLKSFLSGKVPENSISRRIRAFIAGEPDSFRRALGDMSLEEVQVLVHGGDPLAPTSESLLGQYLKQTGATTLVRTFEDAAGVEAGKAGAQGPRKLVVALSEKSFSVFERLFNRKEWMSVVGHANMIHDGKHISYGGETSDLRLPGTEFTPYPMVLLKSTEADRLTQYLKLFQRESALGMGGWDHKASAPWELDGYCAVSAWNGSCTQHLGNLPLGDKLVSKYKMPGDSSVRELLNPRPRIKFLTDYSEADPLIRRVWKVPGNERFSDLIKQEGANLRGEFANPGWTIWTLLGPTTVERVPIVFIIRPNHKLPIPAEFVPAVEGRL